MEWSGSNEAQLTKTRFLVPPPTSQKSPQSPSTSRSLALTTRASSTTRVLRRGAHLPLGRERERARAGESSLGSDSSAGWFGSNEAPWLLVSIPGRKERAFHLVGSGFG